jgi:hypothetical protein
MTIKVIGAGFGRTGTSSLKGALDILGFGPCYHMWDIMQKPAHIALWQQAAHNGQGDWATIFDGYQATMDWPSAFFYRELIQQYPTAKVILTLREPESWYTSSYETIYQDQLHPEMFAEYGWPLSLDVMVKTIVWEGTFQNRFPDRAYAIDVFQRHNAEVQRVVPAEQLLVYEVNQGWEPLCHFLATPIPTTPFPHTNRSEDFLKES